MSGPRLFGDHRVGFPVLHVVQTKVAFSKGSARRVASIRVGRRQPLLAGRHTQHRAPCARALPPAVDPVAVLWPLVAFHIERKDRVVAAVLSQLPPVVPATGDPSHGHQGARHDLSGRRETPRRRQLHLLVEGDAQIGCYGRYMSQTFETHETRLGIQYNRRCSKGKCQGAAWPSAVALFAGSVWFEIKERKGLRPVTK